MRIVIGRGNNRKVHELAASRSRSKIENEIICEDLKAFIFRPETFRMRDKV